MHDEKAQKRNKKFSSVPFDVIVRIFGLDPAQRSRAAVRDQSARVTVSISQRTCLGSSFTATQERAGLLTKYFA